MPFQLILVPVSFCSITFCLYQDPFAMPFIIHPFTNKGITIPIPTESLLPASFIPEPLANILFVMPFPTSDISAGIFTNTFS